MDIRGRDGVCASRPTKFGISIHRRLRRSRVGVASFLREHIRYMNILGEPWKVAQLGSKNSAWSIRAQHRTCAIRMNTQTAEWVVKF